MMEEPDGRENVAAASALEPVPAPTEAFEKAFRDHHGLVFRAACRITGNAADAEDVLQTVFLRLLRRSPAADGVADLRSYLYRAAVNCALDLMRAKKAAPSIPLEELAPRLVQDPRQAADRNLSANELRQWLRRAVARLSPRTAEMFVLRFFEEKDNPAIAALLGTTEGAVAVTLSRARDRIEQEFHSFMGGKS